jgi:S-phase kinase-associated protein 1
MEETDRTLSLVSKTGEKFEVSYKAAKLSQLVSDATEKFDDQDTTPDVEILKVESECLKKVVEFLEHYDKEPLDEIKTPLNDNTFEGVVKQEWYREFVSVDNPMLFDLVTAANFMAIQPLLDLTCLQVSCQLMGKSAEEIRLILNIAQMTEQEERDARRDHRWIFDD